MSANSLRVIDLLPLPRQRVHVEAVLWPCRAWSALLGYETGSELNIIAKAVLGLMATGLRDVAALSSLLSLTEDLVAHGAIPLLRRKGLIDSQSNLTDEGRSSLSTAILPNRQTHHRWVIQSETNGEILSVVETLQGPGTTTRGNDVFVDLGDTGRPLSVRPYLLSRPDAVKRPSADAVQRYLDQEHAEVGFLAEWNEPLWAVVPIDFDGRAGWNVPSNEERTNRALAGRLSGWIKEEASRAPELLTWLVRQQERLRDNPTDALLDRLRDRSTAEQTILARVGDVLPEAVQQYAVEFVEQLLTLRRRGIERGPEVRAAFVSLRLALEQAFEWIRDTSEPDSAVSLINIALGRFPRPEMLAQFHCERSRQAGFSVCPEAFRRVRSSDMYGMLKPRRNTNGRLRPLVMATVVVASLDPHHILHVAALRRNDLLLLIDRVAAACGAVIHGSTPAIRVAGEELQELVLTVLSDTFRH